VRLDDEMQERAQCIPAEDGSKLGQIGMVLSKEEYRKRVGLNQSDWQEPQAAGNYPTKSTTETKEDYDVRVCIWNIRKETAELFKLGQNTVRANFFEAFDPEFTEGLRKQKAGSFKQITLMDCLQYMKANYGEWDLDAINDNEARLDEPWDGSGSIIPILHKFEEVAELAVIVESPIATVNMVTKLLDVIKPVAAFRPAVREILMQDYRAWTWEAVKEHLEKCDRAREPYIKSGNGYQANSTSDSGGGSPSKKVRKTSQIDENGLMMRKTNKFEAIATYCWSHGTSFDRSHHSGTCPDPERGHISEATIYDGAQNADARTTKWPTNADARTAARQIKNPNEDECLPYFKRQ
jgi:hypothetical protein